MEKVTTPGYAERVIKAEAELKRCMEQLETAVNLLEWTQDDDWWAEPDFCAERDAFLSNLHPVHRKGGDMTPRAEELIRRLVAENPTLTTRSIGIIREWAGEQQPECQRCHSKEKLVLCWKCADDLCADGIPTPQPVAGDEEESECKHPCSFNNPCEQCAPYWQRMVSEGLWNGNGWTDKGMKEMMK